MKHNRNTADTFPKTVGRFFIHYLFAHPWWFLGFIIPFAFARITQYSIYPLFAKYAIGWIENPPVADVFGYALPYLIGFVGLVALVNIAWVLRYHYEQKIEESARLSMGQRLQNYIHTQSLGFYSRSEPGKLARNIDYIQDGLRPCILDGLVSFILLLVMMGVSAVLLWRVSTLMTIVFIIVNILGIVWTVATLPVFMRHTERYANLNSEISGRLNDSLINFMTVKLFAGRLRECRLLHPLRRRLMRQGVLTDLWDSFFWAPTSWLLDASVVFSMGVAIYLAMHGQMTAADAVFCIVTYQTVSDCLFDMLMKFPEIAKGYSCARGAWRELIRPLGVSDVPGARDLVVTRGKIEIRHLNFKFADDHDWVLRHLNLTIAPGEKVGIVGLSGNGKTTLARLLMRLYDVTDGEILIDGQNIHDVTQESLRRAISFVPQEETMFNRTLRENIAYGRPGASMDDIIAATRMANAYDFVTKTRRGFSTVIGTRGIKISGGQRQRISLARAFLKNAPILILDEATSALDSESEGLVQASIEKLTQNRTCLIIAHRLSTLKHVDRIIVLEHGRVVESGTHLALSKRKKGIYARLWQMQSCGFIGN